MFAAEVFSLVVLTVFYFCHLSACQIETARGHLPLRVGRRTKKCLPPSLVYRYRFIWWIYLVAHHPKRAQDKHKEALPLMKRALAITTCALGETHEDTIKSQTMVKVLEDKVRGQESSWSEVVW